MLSQELSNRLWAILALRPHHNRLHSFSTKTEGRVIIQTFSVWRQNKNGRREKRRDYYRLIRLGTELVLYDQLEDVSQAFVDSIETQGFLVPDIPLSPERANKLLCAALEEQKEIDAMMQERDAARQVAQAESVQSVRSTLSITKRG